MHNLHLVLVFALILGSVMTSGCDKVRTTRQFIVVRIRDATTAAPLEGIKMQMKSDFDSEKPQISKNDNLRTQWEALPWFSSTSDERGKATIALHYTALDRTSGDTPPRYRDATDAVYLIAVGGKECSVRLESGNVVRCGEFTIDIVDVGNTAYAE